MTQAITFKYKSRLAKQLAQPGGRTIADAVRLAERGVEGHRESGMRAMAAILGQLEQACRAREAASGQSIYDLAAGLLDMAGFFDTGPFYGAAYSLCDLADAMLASGTWDWPPVEVHVRALRLILTDGCVDGEASTAVLAGLKALVSRAR